MKKIAKWLHTQRLLVFAVLVIALLGIGGTMALFTDTEAAVNRFTVGKNTITVDEKPEGLSKQQIGITNTGTIPVYVRMQVNVPEGIKYIEKGEEKSLTPVYDPQTPDSAYWIDGEDGFWYYKTPLQPGARSEFLYDSISFEGIPADQLAEIKDLLDITVYGESVQSEGFPEEVMQRIADAAKNGGNPAKIAFEQINR